MEEYKPEYHQQFEQKEYSKSEYRSRVAIVAVDSVFPDKDGKPQNKFRNESATYFDKKYISLPKNKRNLPDVADHMDGSQIISLVLAENVLSKISNKSLYQSTGTVIGMDGKAERSVPVLQRLYADRINRHLQKSSYSELFCKRVLDYIDNKHIPTGPYTLPGLMPNVAAGRIAQMNNLQGANMVINGGSESLWKSFKTAASLLDFDDCDMVLVGGVSYLDQDSLKI